MTGRTPGVTVRAAHYADGRYSALQTLHDTLWDNQQHARGFDDILAAVGVHPDDVALFAGDRGDRSDTRLAEAFDRLYNWGATNQVAASARTRKAASGVGVADVHVLAGWAAVLVHPDISDVDGWKINSAVTPLVVEHRKVPHGWLYAAAGLSAREARKTPVDSARAMAALRGHVLPVPSARNSAPLVSPQP